MSQTFSPDSEFSPLETPRVPNAGSSLSISALARFEFEAGKGNEGTKILMVEWEDDHLTRSSAGSWHVSWEGKTTVLPADEETSENTRRFYFLLPPGVTIPPVVTLTYTPHPSSASTVKPESVQLNPLPAIFPAELGATARTAGKKGVLHTIWAKKRLQALEKEIRDEFIKNAEGVAVQMAIQEKEWIESNFGVSAPSAPSQNVLSSSPAPSSEVPSYAPATPISPAGGRKLGEKLKGLKLQTSEMDLAKRAEGQTAHNDANAGAHLLSPESPDVAVSSFNSFCNAPPPASDNTRRVVAHHPPESLQQAQDGGGAEFGFDSLRRTESTDSGDELFAKALSPRSPDLPRSPFSFSPQDTMRYVATKEA